ncbi:MAG: hypothetical protein ABJF50_08810 [Paracoccaceae bacterium]
MLKISVLAITQADSTALAHLQREIDILPTYGARVELADKRFKSKPRSLFERVRDALEISCGDLVRCGYCEDSCADEVEHVWPKAFFPNKTFLPNNYLFACGRCNPTKGNKFAIWSGAGWVDLKERRKTHGYIQPPAALSKFIDPVFENPLDLIWLDIAGGSFRFTEINAKGTKEYDRANFTIETLRLNKEVLVRSRRNAYSGFVDRINMYIQRKIAGDNHVLLRNRLVELRRAPHQTVRFEMARQLPMLGLVAGIDVDYPELFL